MNLNQVFGQVDQFYKEKKGEEAEHLMRKSISQAIKEEDDVSLLQLMNELLGYYRETSQVENSFIIANQAIALTKKMGLDGTLPYATTLLNVANAYRAGGKLEESLERYNEVQKIYGQKLAPDNMLMASLQNNLSLLYQEMGDFQAAKECLLRALPVVQAKKADFEVAVTYANLASTCMSLDEAEEANLYASEAIKGFDALGVRDSHYGAALSAQGTFYFKKGEYETAVGIFREAMEIIEARLGKNEYYYRMQDNIAVCEEEIEKERQARELKARMEEQARAEEAAEQAAREAEEQAVREAAEQAAREAEAQAAREAGEQAAEPDEELELQDEMERYLAQYLTPNNTEKQQTEEELEQTMERQIEPDIYVPVQNPFDTESSAVEYGENEIEQEVFVSEQDEDEETYVEQETLEFENTEDDFEDEEESEMFVPEQNRDEDEAQDVEQEVFEFENTEDDFEDEEEPEAFVAEAIREEDEEETEPTEVEELLEEETEEPVAETETKAIYVPERISDGVKGLDLCREYYETYGKPMLEEKFPFYINKIAVGLVGEGSDCFGFDDDISRDHDWGPDFCLWLSDETYAQIGASLQDAYDQLPKDFKGYQRTYSEQGQGRRGVKRISDFYRNLLQASTWEEIDWRKVSDASLAAAVNGEVFRDAEGVFTEFRNKLLQGYPEHIKQLKIADSMARFSQTGQYNFARVLKRGDVLTAQLMAADCIKEAMKLQHYIEGTYPPHDKWLYRSIQNTEDGKTLAAALAKLRLDLQQGMSTDGNFYADSVDLICEDIESIASFFSSEMYVNNVISDSDTYLDEHTDELVQKAAMTTMSDEELIEKIIALEFEAFDKVKNEGGRASCQDDWNTFSIMRKSQYMTWNNEMLQQYLYDFEREWNNGHNLIEEKYGRMMESTAPEEYEKIKDHFPIITPEKKEIIEEIVPIQVGWMEEFSKQYPYLAYNARSIGSGSDSASNTSFETYLRGEISTYSDKMLELYGRFVVEYAKANKNLTLDTMQNSVRLYGYGTLESAESFMKYQNF